MKEESKLLRNMAIMFVVVASISKLLLRREIEQWLVDAFVAAELYFFGWILQDCAFSKGKVIDIHTRKEIKDKLSVKVKDFLKRLITAMICGCIFALDGGVSKNGSWLFRSFIATIASFLGLIL